MMEIRVKLGGEDAEDYKLGQSLKGKNNKNICT